MILGVRFIRFVVIAVFRTLLDILIWQGLVLLLPKSFSNFTHKQIFKLNHYGLAQVFSFVISLIISYYLNIWFVFEEVESNNLGIAVRFILVSLVAFITSTAFINLTTEREGFRNLFKEINLIYNYWPILMKVISTGLTLIINYLGYFFLVF